MLGELGSSGLNHHGQNTTRRKDSLRSFKFETFHHFFASIRDKILYSWHNGIYMLIPGEGYRVVSSL